MTPDAVMTADKASRPLKEPLRNLGPASLRMLQRAGIGSAAQLRTLGAARAFVAVKRAGAKPSLNLLWALEGALTDRPWREVAKAERLSLLLQVEDEEKRTTADVDA